MEIYQDPQEKSQSDIFSVRLPNLEKILKLDACFRHPNPEMCTFNSIKNACDVDPKIGSISKSTFYAYVQMFHDEFGARFKGRELDFESKLFNSKGNRKKKNVYTFSHARFGRQAYYQYEDLNAPLPKLQRLIGKVRQDSGVALLKLLEQESADDVATPVHIWVRLFLDQMLHGGEETKLNAVCFYENLNLLADNRKKFEIILKAILDKQPIEVHNKYDKRGQVKIQPYLLKNYNQRWYLIGKRWNEEPRPTHPDEYYEGYANIALNAIEDLKTEDGEIIIPAIQPWNVEYIEPDELELRDYYSELVGVTASKEGPQDIYLRFNKERYEKYVATKPIVESQRRYVENKGSEFYDPERPTIRLKAHITKELIQQILSFGPDCEVIAPASLREEIMEQIRSVSRLYGL